MRFDETLHQLDAHARAFPLRSSRALASSAMTLDKEMRHELISSLTDAGRGRSRDTAQLVVERAWGTFEHNGELDLDDHIADWAKALLFGEGHGHSVRHRGNDRSSRLTQPEAVLRWRWASLFVPNALLLGAAPGPGANGNLILATPTLDRVLQKGPWAELHIHGGATNDFDAWWVERLTSNSEQLKKAGPRIKVELRMAALLRLVLHACLGLQLSPEELLAKVEHGECQTSVAGWLYAVDGQGLPVEAGRMDSLFPILADTFGYSPRGYEAASWLGPSGSGPSESEKGDRALPNALRQEVDLVRIFYARPKNVVPRRKRRQAQWLSRLFWQYQRLRVAFFSRLVETPGIAGLAHFKTKHGAIKVAGGAREKVFERSLRIESAGLNLGSLEVRETSTTPRALYGFTEYARRVAKGPKPVEMGLILSLLKPGELHDGRPRSGAARFAKLIHKTSKIVDSLSQLLTRVPELLLIVRGIDIANHELSAPTWVIAPYMKKLRQSSRQASELLTNRSFGDIGRTPIPPMRITVHAGEDYWSPIEGLRRIDEFIESGVLGEGDRIGHGLSLGADISRFEGVPFLQPREERLFDLIWELDLAEQRRLSIPGSRILAHKAEIRRLLECFVAGSMADDFQELPRRLLALEDDELRSIARKPPEGDRALDLFFRDEGTYDILRQPVEILFSSEDLAVVESLQEAVVSRVARREILVETNPSSNLLIGDLSSIRNHPVFRLAPIGKGPGNRSRVALAICDDDPLTFNTRLADEICYMYAALRTGPDVAAEDALHWIETAREAAWRGRFTLKESADPARLRRLADALSHSRERGT